MATLLQFNTWLTGTTLGWAVRGGVPWVWPLCETLHFMGMALLVGMVGVLDLRLLGVAKGLPVSALSRLLPWGLAGFALNLLTGFMFYAGSPEQYMGNGDDLLPNQAFELKLLFIALAGLNVLVFYGTGLHRQVQSIEAGQDAPLAAKLLGGASLFLWVGVMYWGRMLPFIGGAF